ncbi:MAG TPA: general stress protein [Rhodospirillaceae bacterium]|nr:general stress protein [Alphaproteobacteria bacterium]OUT42490.1 MAG: hypothetical protein CBB62_09575 [Micavibrio sp. TMED2]HCI45865.1 general stress protein [Rhodospirillaceae bacterium]MAS45851.1 general stress protein [Alphaproteobacteria bacterium]MAX95967.1 general stress protein [Alphaproteobacteria bacterium]|tara:strand:+ start:6713 stop:7201 length:489 start_codon:yes stop_codon:yes gene_type:complete
MSNNEEKLWHLIRDIHNCMMVTKEPSGAMRARPMHAFVEPERKEIWFYTRLDNGKSIELQENGDICLCFSSPSDSDYISISGHASLDDDRQMIDKHWSPFVDAWFPEGKDSPVVGMIRVAVDKGEYWDGKSGSIVSAIRMLVAAETDEMPDLGDHGKVAISR